MEPALEEWVENVRMLTESAGAVVPADGTLARVRAARFTEPGFSREVWATIVEMGWLGICLGEEAGGYGLGLREAVALTGLLGKGLVPEPVINGFTIGIAIIIAKAASGRSVASPESCSTRRRSLPWRSKLLNIAKAARFVAP